MILSSEATDETFEQHKKLRTRAEDYLHKPIGFEDLLTRVKQFVEIENNGAAAADDELEVDDLEVGMEVELIVDTLYEDDEHVYTVWKWRPTGAAATGED